MLYIRSFKRFGIAVELVTNGTPNKPKKDKPLINKKMLCNLCIMVKGFDYFCIIVIFGGVLMTKMFSVLFINNVLDSKNLKKLLKTTKPSIR